MAVADLLKRISSTQQELRSDRGKAYRKLVADVADEREPDASAVANVLQDAGKTVDDLAADVKLLVERRQLSEQAKSISELERKMAAIRKKADAAVEAFKPIQEKHDDELARLDDDFRALHRQLQAAERAKQRLIQTVTDEDLLARKGELSEVLSAKHNELSEARKLLELRKERLREAGMIEIKPQRVEEESKWTARISESNALIPQLESEAAAMEAERKEFEQQLLEP